MRISELPILCDENIAAHVVEHLLLAGHNATTVDSAMKAGGDPAILEAAFLQGRVVMTHDADFGRIAVLSGSPVIGVIYIRPGHIDAKLIIRAIESLYARDPEVIPPFVLVIRFGPPNKDVTIRYRSL